MSALRDMQKAQLRWPEIVTFEEMGIQPPNFFYKRSLSIHYLDKQELSVQINLS